MRLFGFSISTLEECAKLFPDGHTYKVEIILDADKTEKCPTMQGSFGVTGGADAPDTSDIGDFIECVGPLLKALDIDTSDSSNS
ncbi:hypothetical protein AB4277_01225 [Vibrio splendidus]|uniref:hypothetical protein n=1 Tax=Vibrio splendidus TaxID=29497 RepID=UPI000977D17B|nr:hypothetical protein [Vibrio splendidus]OMO23265.1 hypothetical protein BH581_19825 [Vibrio splendidus]PMI84361.1 hypothetical protein BCU37_11885 [Vibrio splendidus]PMK58568.1 hypothetical protein BCT96_16215 [Vibrio splendidus]